MQAAGAGRIVECARFPRKDFLLALFLIPGTLIHYYSVRRPRIVLNPSYTALQQYVHLRTTKVVSVAKTSSATTAVTAVHKLRDPVASTLEHRNFKPERIIGTSPRHRSCFPSSALLSSTSCDSASETQHHIYEYLHMSSPFLVSCDRLGILVSRVLQVEKGQSGFAAFLLACISLVRFAAVTAAAVSVLLLSACVVRAADFFFF